MAVQGLEGLKKIGKGHSIGTWDLPQATVGPCQLSLSSVQASTIFWNHNHRVPCAIREMAFLACARTSVGSHL